MIFTTRLKCFSFLAFFAATAFAANVDEVRATYCIKWLVNGTDLIRVTSQQDSSLARSSRVSRGYPLPYILHNLGLNEWIPNQWRTAVQFISKRRLVFTNMNTNSAAQGDLAVSTAQAGAQILSLGEGDSGLLPLLLANETNAVGVDIDYTQERVLGSASLARLHLNTLQGSATDLSAFRDESQQLVLSHDLFAGLDRQQRIDTLRESFRVLAPTGTARHALLIPDVKLAVGADGAALFATYESLLVAQVRQLVEDALGTSGYELSIFVDEPKMRLKRTADVDFTQLAGGDAIGLERLVEQSSALSRKSLSLLIVLRRPDNSWSMEGVFGRWGLWN